MNSRAAAVRFLMGSISAVKRSSFEVPSDAYVRLSKPKVLSVDYSCNGGALIQQMRSGKASAIARPEVGDRVVEVHADPIGVFNGRAWEVWRQ